MQKLTSQPSQRSTAKLHYLKLAESQDEIQRAQKLRYDVFSAEYGASMQGGDGLDNDYFDAFCKHLIVVNQESGEIVATTRFLLDQGAQHAGKYYAETEFDLNGLKQTGYRIMELGRTCIHPDYRAGAALSTLWSGVARQFLESEHDVLIGCGSISMQDRGARVWSIYEFLKQKHLADQSCRTTPLKPVPHLADARIGAACHPADIPPLMRAYMRLGAKICGEPCWDPDFRCADFLILLRFDDLAHRYKRHFLKTKGR